MAYASLERFRDITGRNVLVLQQAKELEQTGVTVFPQSTEIRCNQFANGAKEYYLL